MSGPILIQGAMEVETDHLVAQLTSTTEHGEGGFHFWQGTWRGQDLVVSRTEVGTICAAAATALGILRFAPCAVINQGLAGSHSEELHVGDIVVGRSCVNIHDLETPVRGRGEGSDPFAWALHDHTEHSPGEDGLICPADDAWAERFERAPYAEGRKVSGRLGSGDVFNRETDRILALRAACGHLCEDMESIAAYRVARRFGIPCVGVRIISNNELTGEAYRRSTAAACQRFVLSALRGNAAMPTGTSIK